MPKERQDKSEMPISLDMYIVMRDYFQTDVANLSKYISQCVDLRNQAMTKADPRAFQQSIKISESIEYLRKRMNVASNCILFLKRKINQWREKKKT